MSIAMHIHHIYSYSFGDDFQRELTAYWIGSSL